jgi:hypothetical protein
MWKQLILDDHSGSVDACAATPAPSEATVDANEASESQTSGKRGWKFGPLTLAALAVCAHPYAGFR